MSAGPSTKSDSHPGPGATPSPPDGPLWRFALAFYAKPGVAEALLTLQNEADVDVVHALMTVYACSIRGQALSADDISAARRSMANWRAVAVLPLRRIRKELASALPKPEAETLRVAVMNAELLAEQIQIGMAERWLDSQQTSNDLTREECLGLLVDHYYGRDHRSVDSLLSAVEVIVDASHEGR